MTLVISAQFHRVFLPLCVGQMTHPVIFATCLQQRFETLQTMAYIAYKYLQPIANQKLCMQLAK